MTYYSKKSHTVFYHRYHIVWITKYRYKVLTYDIKKRVRELVLQVAEEIGIEVISTFEFIDGFFGKATASQIRDLSKQDDIFWIEHNSQMEYYMQDTTRVINAVETWQTVIINENEQVIADQANQHTYIDGTGVAARLQLTTCQHCTNSVWKKLVRLFFRASI